MKSEEWINYIVEWINDYLPIELSTKGKHLFGKFLENSTLPLKKSYAKDFFDCFYKFAKDQIQIDNVGEKCPFNFDGTSCWTSTEKGAMMFVHSPCFDESKEIKRYYQKAVLCLADGTWSASSNEECDSDEELMIKTLSSSMKLIYYIGYALSFTALITALCYFLTLKDLRCLRNTIHINLLLSYLLLSIFQLLSATLSDDVDVILGCLIHSIAQYAVLTNFFWIFVEGLNLYQMTVTSALAKKIKLGVYLLIGWGLPVPFICTWIALKLDLAVKNDWLTKNSNLFDMCPFEMKDIFDWAIRAPVATLSIFCNIILLLIVWVLIRKLRPLNSTTTLKYWRASRAFLSMILFIDVSYIILIPESLTLELIEVTLLSTQGFWIALACCFLNNGVRKGFKTQNMQWFTNKTSRLSPMNDRLSVTESTSIKNQVEIQINSKEKN